MREREKSILRERSSFVCVCIFFYPSSRNSSFRSVHPSRREEERERNKNLSSSCSSAAELVPFASLLLTRATNTHSSRKKKTHMPNLKLVGRSVGRSVAN